MSFYSQSKRAKALTRGYRANYKLNKAVGRDVDLYGNPYYDYQLKRGFDAAYESPSGYSVLKNPISDENEVFVRGTKYGGEWLQNALEALPSVAGAAFPSLGLAASGSYRKRGAFAKKVETARKKTNAKVVYGHSRGAAVVADMTSSAKKVGVDGAMLLAPKSRRDFVNYRQSQWFDWLISRGETRKRVVPRSSWKPWKRGFHKTYVH